MCSKPGWSVTTVVQSPGPFETQAPSSAMDQDEDVLNRLGRMRHPIPRPLLTAASLSLDDRLHREIEKLDAEGAFARIQFLCERSKAWGYQPGDRAALRQTLTEQLESLLNSIHAAADLPKATAYADKLLDAAQLLETPLDLWQTQNQVLHAYLQLTRSDTVGPETHDAFAAFAARLNVSPDMLGWRP